MYSYFTSCKYIYKSKGDIAMTTNKKLNAWVAEMAALTKPDKIVWIDGSEAQQHALQDEAVSTGEMTRLNQDLLPGCY